MVSAKRLTQELLEQVNEDPKVLRIPEYYPPLPKLGITKPILVPRTTTQFHPEEMRIRIESVNAKAGQRPYDPRKAYPNWGATYAPAIQKVCPTCRLVLRRPQMRSTFYAHDFSSRCECPACHTLLEI